jgi:hypothetical protein
MNDNTTITFGAYAQTSIVPLPSGILRHSLILLNAPGRTHGAAFKPSLIYRKHPLTTTSRPVKRLETIFIGQILVTLCREAIDNGEVTREQIKTMQEVATEIYGKGWIYRDRQAHHDCIDRLFRLTGNPDHFYNDIRIEL